MLDLSATAICPKCGRTLASDAPRGMCVKCLYSAMLDGGPLDHALASRSEAALPRAFGAYELLEEIARGGMGVVYRARQVSLNRLVALKVIRDSSLASPQAVRRFQIEAEAAAKLQHPNIVPIYEFGEADGKHFLSMKLVEGEDLGKGLHGRPMNPRPLAQLMATLARAIHHAHQRGVLHRDLKPANVLLDAKGQPNVTDFGLAKLAGEDAALTLSTDILGSPNYMAPEQAAGGSDQVTMAADVYSLGAIMYELLTGWAPFRADTPLRTMRKVLEEEPQTPRTLYKLADPDLETICLRCMEKAPSRRYGSAETLAEDLERWLRKEPIQARPSTTTERLGKWVRRNPKVAALTLLLLLALTTGLGGILLMNVRLSSANQQKDIANVQLATKVRDFEWQKVEDLVAAGKWSHALALLGAFLRENPGDQCAATRAFSMLNSDNFLLPVTTPFQHGAPVSSVSISADGQRILTTADDGMARIWDLRSGRLLVAFPHPQKVRGALFDAEERLVFTSCQDGSFRLWDAEHSNLLMEFPKAPNSRTPPAVSRDHRRVALPDSERSMRVWDIAEQRPLSSRLELPGRVTRAVFSCDPNIIALASANGALGVWSVEDSRLLVPILQLPREAGLLGFSPDGTILAAASSATITLWDTHTWLKLREFKAHETDVLMIGFTPDGQRLVTVGYGQSPKIWDVASGSLLGQLIKADQPSCFFHISPDGRSLATRSQSGVVRMWDALTGLAISEPFEHEGPVTDLAFTPDGQSLLTASQDGTVQVLNIQHSHPSPPVLKTEYNFSCACFTRDGRHVVATRFGTVLMFDATTHEAAGKPMVPEHTHIYRIKPSPDGSKLATAGYGGSVQIWNLAACEPQTRPLPLSQRVAGLAFSPDSRLLATACEDATARLWDAETGEPKSPPLRHDSEVLAVAFSPDSRLLLTASGDGTARLWQVADGSAVLPEPLRHKGIVWSAEFDPSARRILTASADKSAEIWDAQSRRPMIPPIRHERSVSGARFSPDGNRVLTWSEDGTARVWDSQSGQPISQPMRHRDVVHGATFSPDGTQVLTGSKDGVVRLWDAATGYPLSEPLQNRGPINALEFSPDGRRFLTYADRDALRIWDVVIPPVPVPPWFCDLIQAVAGKRLSPNRDPQPVGSDGLQALRTRFAALHDSDFYSRWAKWFLWDRMKNPAPEFVPAR